MSFSLFKIFRSHVILSQLIPLIIGIVVEMAFPGKLNSGLLMLSALLCLLLSFLIKCNDSANAKIRPFMLIGVCGIMFSLGSFCLSSLRVNDVQNLCDKSSQNSVLIAHISSELKSSSSGVSCLADVYCYDDSLQTLTDEDAVLCRLNVHCGAGNLSAGDIVVIPKNAVSTADRNDFAQFVYARFLSMQGVQALCDVDTFEYISHLSKNDLVDKAVVYREYLKNTLKKTKL